jgi:hypothetical protein
MMMNGIICKLALVLSIVFITGCDASTKPYIEHELSYKKLGDDCSGQSDKFSMASNTNGERYILQECLNSGFKKEDLLVQRKGDTVVIDFRRDDKGNALYELTIDVDTYPQYKFLTIGENTFTVVPGVR